MDVALTNSIVATATNLASAQTSDALNMAVLKSAGRSGIKRRHHDRRHAAIHAPARAGHFGHAGHPGQHLRVRNCSNGQAGRPAPP